MAKIVLDLAEDIEYESTIIPGVKFIIRERSMTDDRKDMTINAARIVRSKMTKDPNFFKKGNKQDFSDVILPDEEALAGVISKNMRSAVVEHCIKIEGLSLEVKKKGSKGEGEIEIKNGADLVDFIEKNNIKSAAGKAIDDFFSEIYSVYTGADPGVDESIKKP